jgi:predicted ABC-class ATPase
METINRDFEILTDYILTFYYYKYLNVDLIENWVIELINSGYESEAIYTLACFYKPIDSDEVQPHLETVFSELNLTAKNKAESQKSHIRYFLNKVLKQEDVRSNLKRMLQFSFDFDIDKDLTDLSALQYLWDDLEDGQVNWHYKDLSLDTIEQEVVEKAKKWMREN